MNPEATLAAIRAELLEHAEPWKLPQIQRFFREPIDAYCTYTPFVRAIARRWGKEFSLATPAERGKLTRALWKSGKFEEGSVAIQLYARMQRQCGDSEWALLTRWLDKEIRNWAHCDALCGDVLGLLLIARTDRIGELDAWVESPAVYRRRAALVAPLKGVRKGLFRQSLVRLRERLGADREPMIRKAWVWSGKELAR